jgi:hypothetical protein
MLVCTCCGHWQIMVDQHLKLYRIRSYGTVVCDVRTIEEVERVLTRYGKSLADFEDPDTPHN